MELGGLPLVLGQAGTHIIAELAMGSVLFEGLPRTTRRYIFSMNTQYRSVLFEALPRITKR
jgi:hypothetical protein